ncbi:uncharacterized protein LOC100573328 [Acyrthosiphon pisum]|uniref:Uncharacterized protein n=1 Tax=Acyrthosiphon pisum TaxID=7029 RepID=A0A8R2D3J9_ACYPI|nr:uncharacterized protein LOC100573328 [Acyrthosiphon pisum]|eukprot:XP_008180918.1 PREDICTED: uncharacterized protein LOC100573328 [Acyrthosiphon pisum]
MPRNKTTCDENRPTAEFDRFEFRGGRLIVGCKCTRNDGMQHECERLKCMADRTSCLTYPAATCLPSRPCPPRPPHHAQDNGYRDDSRAESQSSHQPVDGGGGNGGSVGGGTGVVGTGVGGTGGERSPGRDVRYRSFNSRRMRKWASDQYDDRPALRKFFRPCRVHCDQFRPATDVCARDIKAKVIL